MRATHGPTPYNVLPGEILPRAWDCFVAIAWQSAGRDSAQSDSKENPLKISRLLKSGVPESKTETSFLESGRINHMRWFMSSVSEPSIVI